MGDGALRLVGDFPLGLALGLVLVLALGVERVRRGRAARRHHVELRTLHRIGEALAATFDLEKQLEILGRELKALMGVRNFYLVFQDSPGGRLETVWALEWRVPEEALKANGLAEHVLAQGAALRLGRGVAEAARRLGVGGVDPRLKTWCGVPMRFSNGSKAVLAVADFEREEAIDAHAFELFEVLASEAAVAIENARLFAREQQRARHWALLNELGRKATSVLDARELLGQIGSQVRQAFGYEWVRVETLDRGRQELVVEAQAGYGEELLGWRSKRGEGLSGTAAATGEPVLASQVSQDARYVALDARVRSALSLPLKFGGETLGVLTLESRRAQDFTPQDRLTLETLADQLAIALHNARVYQVAQEQAITDGLTGLKTHRYFMEALEGEWRRSPRSRRPFSVIMMDLDGFKQVNDRHGHLEGDRVLEAVARILEERTRQSNVAARYGGDEFAILMPEGTSEQAAVLAERLRARFASDPLLARHGVTASFGIATFPQHGATPEEILRVADSGMYLAKHARGDRVQVAPSRSAGPAPGSNPQLLEAYLGVAVKRMFSTGPEMFDRYLERFEEATHRDGQSLSLMDTVTALAFAIDAKDHYTQGHSQSVARLATQIARHLGLAESEIEEIRLAAIVHDVGKIGVPESVLNKPTRLTAEEFEVMKTHAELGWKILEPLKVKAIERIRPMVRHHHERFDGSGYPDGLAGPRIPLGARILTIADSYDTMTSARSYKPGRTLEEAAQELERCRGSHFDPTLVTAFLQTLNSIPQPAPTPTLAN